jgi:hypothetical protein
MAIPMLYQEFSTLSLANQRLFPRLFRAVTKILCIFTGSGTITTKKGQLAEDDDPMPAIDNDT